MDNTYANMSADGLSLSLSLSLIHTHKLRKHGAHKHTQEDTHTEKHSNNVSTQTLLDSS